MTRQRWAWLFLTMWTLLTYAINHYGSPLSIEKFYTHGVFQWWRTIYDYSIYHIPFAFSYFIFFILLIGIGIAIKSTVKAIKQKTYVSYLGKVFAFILLVYNSFYLLWGFNYRIHNVSHRLVLQTLTIDTAMVYNEVMRVNDVLERLRSSICIDSVPLAMAYDHEKIENSIRYTQKALLKRWGFDTRSSIHVRALHPSGTLLIWSTAGIYNPYSLEGHYDTGMFHVQSTYVIAHEMAHGYGVTNEADCNFIALLTCAYSGDKYLQYCGLLTYWRYLMSDLRDKAPYSFYKIAYHRPLGVRKDIAALYKALDQYPDVLPQLRDIIYDNYLKSNGIQDGLKSYNKVVDMMMAYNRDGRYEDLFMVVGM